MFGSVKEKFPVSLRRNKEQRLVFELAFGFQGDRFQWIVNVMSNLLVELGIFGFSHLRGRTVPQRFHRVENFVFDGDCRRFILPRFFTRGLDALIVENYRIRNEVGITLDDARQHPFVTEIFNTIVTIDRLQLESNRRTVSGSFTLRDAVLTVAA